MTNNEFSAPVTPSAKESGVKRANKPNVDRITLYVDPATKQELDQAREGSGLNRSQWVVGCIVNALRRQPIFPKAETLALVHVRQELRRIGIALRRAASDLEFAGYPETAKEMRELYGDARDRLEAVRAAVAGNLAYWGHRDG